MAALCSHQDIMIQRRKIKGISVSQNKQSQDLQERKRNTPLCSGLNQHSLGVLHESQFQTLRCVPSNIPLSTWAAKYGRMFKMLLYADDTTQNT